MTIKIFLTDRSGDERAIETELGISLMEAIRDSDFDELLALCGGCCSCATCHVYIDQNQAIDLLPIGVDENDLLDSSSQREARSRLACQILLTSDLDGLRATIAPED